MPDQIVQSTWFQRPLTRTELLLMTVCDDERQAIALAKFIPELPDDATFQQVSDAAVMAMVRVKEIASGPMPTVSYVGGQRRDDKRVQ